jgi:hypothetical protein
MSVGSQPMTATLRDALTSAATHTFPSRDALKVLLGIDEDDDTQDAALAQTMATTIALIEAYLGRGIAYLPAAVHRFESLDARQQKLLLYRFPVASITSVTIEGAAVTGWRLFKSLGILQWRDFPWVGAVEYGRDTVVEVTYAGGYPDNEWPADLLSAVVQAFQERWNATVGAVAVVGGATLAEAGPIKSLTVDGLAVTYADSGTTVAGEVSGGPIPAELNAVAALLDPYRQRMVLGV